mgnify:CR=1 FL=1
MQNLEKIQENLSSIRLYNDQIDGKFGPNTENAIKKYQKSLFDQETGELTDFQRYYLDLGIYFSHGYMLPDDQYIKTETTKKSITVHHIAGWAKKKNGDNSVSYFWGWENNKPRIGTAFSIGIDGTIYAHFNPKYWIFHLGIKNTNGKLDQQSIGIELANEGELTKSAKGYWKFWAGKYNRDDEPIKKLWRGGEYWAPYTEQQLESLAKLTAYLSFEYDINMDFNSKPFEYQPSLIKSLYGINTHANLRSDKTDISPAFNWEKYVDSANFYQKYIKQGSSEQPVYSIDHVETSTIEEEVTNKVLERLGTSTDYTVKEVLNILPQLTANEFKQFIDQDEDRKTILKELD